MSIINVHLVLISCPGCEENRLQAPISRARFSCRALCTIRARAGGYHRSMVPPPSLLLKAPSLHPYVSFGQKEVGPDAKMPHPVDGLAWVAGAVGT